MKTIAIAVGLAVLALGLVLLHCLIVRWALRTRVFNPNGFAEPANLLRERE